MFVFLSIPFPFKLLRNCVSFFVKNLINNCLLTFLYLKISSNGNQALLCAGGAFL